MHLAPFHRSQLSGMVQAEGAPYSEVHWSPRLIMWFKKKSCNMTRSGKRHAFFHLINAAVVAEKLWTIKYKEAYLLASCFEFSVGLRWNNHSWNDHKRQMKESWQESWNTVPPPFFFFSAYIFLQIKCMELGKVVYEQRWEWTSEVMGKTPLSWNTRRMSKSY